MTAADPGPDPDADSGADTVPSWEALFGRAPGNVGTAAIREALAAERHQRAESPESGVDDE